MIFFSRKIPFSYELFYGFIQKRVKTLFIIILFINSVIRDEYCKICNILYLTGKKYIFQIVYNLDYKA